MSSISLVELKEQIIKWEIKNKGDIELYKSLFNNKLKINDIVINTSIITGLPCDGNDWNTNHYTKHRKAKTISDAFGFELYNKETTLKNILNAIEIIRYNYTMEKMSPRDISKLFNIKCNDASTFISKLGIQMKQYKIINTRKINVQSDMINKIIELYQKYGSTKKIEMEVPFGRGVITRVLKENNVYRSSKHI